MREIQHEIVCSVREGFKEPNLVISVNLRQTENGPALSIIGMMGDAAGQIYKDIRRAECFNFRSGWTQEKLDKLLDVWEAYHLNNLQSGTPEQMEILRSWFETVKYPENTYDGQLRQLDKHGMRTHNGHVYGTKWLYLPIPADVLEFLHSL